MSQEIFTNSTKSVESNNPKNNNVYCVICNKELKITIDQKHKCGLRKDSDKIVVSNK